jgi:hypothetical protein
MKFFLKTFLAHLLLVLLFISIPVISSPDFNYSLDLFKVPPFLQNFIGYVLITGFFYLNYYYLLPRYFFRKKYVSYGIGVLICFLLIFGLDFLLFREPAHTPEPFFNPGFRKQPGPLFDFHILINLLVPFLLVLLFSLSLGLNRKTRQIELDKYQAELQNLKYQLQPHFLFNSLNNIYSISILEPQKTPGYILELSEILRYLLKTDGSLIVQLNDDLRFCKQYIDLQKLRFEDNNNWTILIPEAPSELQIAPFLMMPLIENVFKYGIHPDKDSPIRIEVQVIKNSVRITTFNRKNNHSGEHLLLNQGIGLQKTKERLDLLFPGRHQWKIEETEQDFRVDLEIELTHA